MIKWTEHRQRAEKYHANMLKSAKSGKLSAAIVRDMARSCITHIMMAYVEKANGLAEHSHLDELIESLESCGASLKDGLKERLLNSSLADSACSIDAGKDADPAGLKEDTALASELYKELNALLQQHTD